jgi:TrmH family RNA methyltransferase
MIPRIVLARPSHPGNIGSAARAMKNMGCTDLALVNPELFPDRKAFVMAASAADVLNQTHVCDSVSEAVADCQRVIGFSARERTNKPAAILRERFPDLVASGMRIAFVFGSESAGLNNAELDRCDELLMIPTGGEYASLNLAQAVQVVCYEWLSCSRDTALVPRPTEWAEHQEVQGMLEHLEHMIIHTGFIDPDNPGFIMRHMRNLFSRTQLDKREVQILRGIFHAAIAYNDALSKHDSE